MVGRKNNVQNIWPIISLEGMCERQVTGEGIRLRRKVGVGGATNIKIPALAPKLLSLYSF